MQRPTLEELRESVRRKLDDPEYDAIVIDEALNDFQNELFTDHRIRFMETSASVQLIEGDTSISFPQNILTLITLLVQDDSNPYDITKKHIIYEEFMRQHPRYDKVNPAQPWDWTDFGGGVRFSRPADKDYEFAVDYIRQPKYMERDSDRAEVPKVYQEMMVLGGLSKVMDINEDYAESNFESAKLERRITSFVRNYGRGQVKTGPVIMRTNRARGKGSHERIR